MIRIVLISLALLSPFFFPYLLALPLIIAAALYSPLLAVALGGTYEALYYPGFGIPLAFITGVILFALVTLVRQFVKTRIMA